MEIESANDPNYKSSTTTLVTNGTVDIHGRIADKRTTGRWRASSFIIVNEVVERLAFYSVAVNMVSYLVLEMHEPLPDAVTHVTDWIGAAFALTILGAFLADAYLGRFLTIVIFSCFYAVGMSLLTLSAAVDALHPPQCAVGSPRCKRATARQSAFLYSALALIALGTGGIKPCVSSFGADQYDEADEKEAQMKYAFFNWFFFAINMGVILGITLMVYVQVEKGWGWGFGVPTVIVGCSVLVLVAGVRSYRYQKPTGSAFTRFAQVLVASCRNHIKGVGRWSRASDLYEVDTPHPHSDIPGARKLEHTEQYRFLDKAAIKSSDSHNAGLKRSRWQICTVTQVEEFKSFVRVLPVWASTIALSISFAQLSTFFISQALVMDRRLGPRFVIPQASVPVFASVNPLLLVPVYEGLVVPFLRRRTGHRRGITSLQRMGVGLFISVLALGAAAMVEKRRRHHPDPGSVSVFWLLPQYFLMGAAEVFTYVGQLEFFYDEATDGTRSLSSAIFLSEVGIGSWMSTALVKIVEGSTGGEGRGWLRKDLNRSRLDSFYWILCGINAVNFVVYLGVAYKYRGRSGEGRSVRDEALLVEGHMHEHLSSNTTRQM